MNPPGQAEAPRLHAWYARLAIAAAALTFVVIVASAFMRHWQSGLACPDWPACYGRIDAEAVAAPPFPVRAARVAHRLAATGVLAAIAGLLLVAWTQTPRRTREGTLAAIAFAITLGLAALGVATPGSLRPAVTLGNLLGGFAILALLAAAATHAGRGDPEPGSARVDDGCRSGAFAVVIGLALAAATLGGSIGAHYALTQCTAPPAADIAVAEALASLRAIAPLRALSVSGGRVVPPADMTGLCTLHGAAGGIVAVAATMLALALRRAHRALAWLLAALALATAISGAATLATRPSLPLTLAHNACAALLLAALAAGAVRMARVPRGRLPHATNREPAT